MTDNRQGNMADNMANTMRNAGEGMRNAGQRAAENSASINLKIIDQVEQNAREAFNAMRAAANARSLNEVIEIQTNYVREQSNRGMGQIREIGDMIANFGRQAMSSMSSAASAGTGAAQSAGTAAANATSATTGGGSGGTGGGNA